MSNLTAEEQKAIDDYQLVLNVLKVPLKDSTEEFPKDRLWTLPKLDAKVFEDLPGSGSGPQTGSVQSASTQSQETQSYTEATKTATKGGSAKQAGGN